MGTLDSKGIIDFYIKAGPTTPRGGQMFNEMIYSYGAVFQMTKDQDVVIARVAPVLEPVGRQSQEVLRISRRSCEGVLTLH